MLIWSLLWAAPHRAPGMTMVCWMEEGHEFKLQADCQPVFCCLGYAGCDLRSYLTWEGQVVKPLALSHSNRCNCLKAGGLSSQGVFREWTVSGPQYYWCKRLYHMILMKLKYDLLVGETQVNSVLVVRYFFLHVSYTIFHMTSNFIVVLSLIW